MAKLTKYFVTDSLRHDGKDYAIGSTVELDLTAATPLLASGVVSGEPPEALPLPIDPVL